MVLMIVHTHGNQLHCLSDEMLFNRCIEWALILTVHTCGIAQFYPKAGTFYKKNIVKKVLV